MGALDDMKLEEGSGTSHLNSSHLPHLYFGELSPSVLVALH